MKTYVCLLRAINVGGNNLIKMQALKDSLLKAGLKNVQTYLQSGNLIISSDIQDESIIRTEIEKTIKTNFNLDIQAIIFNEKEWISLSDQNPFQEEDPKSVYITMLERNPEIQHLEFLETKLLPEDKIKVGDRALYLCFPKGYGTTKFTLGFVEKQLGMYATTRNKNTVEQIKHMLT